MKVSKGSSCPQLSQRTPQQQLEQSIITEASMILTGLHTYVCTYRTPSPPAECDTKKKEISPSWENTNPNVNYQETSPVVI